MLTISKKDQEALKEFKRALKENLQENLLEVILFGSKARGDDREDSDIDVLVITAEDDWRLCDIACEIATDILLDGLILISPKVIGKKQYDHLCRLGTPFIKNVIREGIKL